MYSICGICLNRTDRLLSVKWPSWVSVGSAWTFEPSRSLCPQFNVSSRTQNSTFFDLIPPSFLRRTGGKVQTMFTEDPHNHRHRFVPELSHLKVGGHSMGLLWQYLYFAHPHFLGRAI